jgi:hypothetical protein
MEELPLNGRDFMQLSMLAAGSRLNTVKNVPVERETTGAGLNYQVHIDGQQITNTQFTSDAGAPEISRDAVAEFEFVANRFDARQGRSAGVQVNVVTKSGTNAFLGSLSGYFRDDSMNARDFIVKRVLPQSDSQVSGTFGGPIRRDRIHFFGNYEYEREPQAVVFTGPYPKFNIPDLHAIRNEQKGGARVDFQFSSSTRLMVRASRWYNDIPFSIPQLTPGATFHPSTLGGGREQSNQVSASLTQTHGLTTLNEIRAGYNTNGFLHLPQVPDAPSITLRGYTLGPRLGYPHEFNEMQYVIRDDFTFTAGRHDVKTGGEYLRYNSRNYKVGPLNGTIDATGGPVPGNIEDLFPVWNDPRTWNLAALSPITVRFKQGLGDPNVRTPRDTGAAWLQDDVSLGQHLVLNLGLRYDVAIGGLGERGPAFLPWRPKELLHSDLANIAPRLGFAYSFANTTVIRGGWGKYFAETLNNLNTSTALAFQRVTPETPNDGRPDFAANPYNGQVPTYESVKASGARLDLTDTPADPGYRTPYSNQASLGLEHQIGPVIAVTADYTWSGGHRELASRNRNLNYNPETGANYPFKDISKRPYPDSGSARMLYGEGWSNLYSFLSSVTKRFSHHWQASATYTLSYFKDGLPNPSWVPFPLAADLGRQYSLAVSDQRNRAVANAILELPRGFQVSGVYFYGSGQRYSTTYGGDLRDTGGTDGAGRLRPDGTIVPRNNFVGHPTHRIDMRFQRRFKLTDHTAVDGLVEVFNMLNHANYGSYTTAESNANYGQPSQNNNMSYQPRMVQLGFKFTF